MEDIFDTDNSEHTSVPNQVQTQAGQNFSRKNIRLERENQCLGTDCYHQIKGESVLCIQTSDDVKGHE